MLHINVDGGREGGKDREEREGNLEQCKREKERKGRRVREGKD